MPKDFYIPNFFIPKDFKKALVSYEQSFPTENVLFVHTPTALFFDRVDKSDPESPSTFHPKSPSPDLIEHEPAFPPHIYPDRIADKTVFRKDRKFYAL